ncbi:MAG: alanine racemase [Candidatus Nomurabacteria bacterium]|nr:MAG: alanine racemase [Candidatus Nomurabacteria bacterium]
MPKTEFTWIELSKSALVHNAKAFRRISGNAKLMAVVKSNAYGLGTPEVVKILQNNVDVFGTANLDEALELRALGIRKPIVVLSYWDTQSASAAVQNNISLVLHSFAQLQEIRALPTSLQKRLSLHLKLDVGTSRIGFLPNELAKLKKLLLAKPALKMNGVFSHFAQSESNNKSFTLQQNKRFQECVEELQVVLDKKAIRHISCTAAVLKYPKMRYDMLRVGLGMYGLWPAPELKKIQDLKLRPVLSWKTRVLAIKTLPPSTTIGYDRTYRVKKKMRVAVLPIGYFEGLQRSLSNNGQVLLRGKVAKFLGRLSMNLSVVNCELIPQAKAGDEVVIIGRQGREELSAQDIAKDMGTINYEVITHIHPLLPRHIVK